MRGKAGPNSAHNAASGITPAYAGKSEYRSFFPARPWDHPRVCGEKNGNYDTQACGGGSPPRMRGKGGLGQNARFKARITPAYAGKRHSPCMRGTCPRDHPRVCGEKAFMAFCRNCAVGSPPRMRGKVCFLGCISVLTGITPAYAGKSYLIGTGLSDTKDHPRVCGEKTVLDLSRLVEQGSPPRMRGKADPPSARFRVHGITPAYAGKRVL